MIQVILIFIPGHNKTGLGHLPIWINLSQNMKKMYKYMIHQNFAILMEV